MIVAATEHCSFDPRTRRKIRRKRVPGIVLASGGVPSLPISPSAGEGGGAIGRATLGLTHFYRPEYFLNQVSE